MDFDALLVEEELAFVDIKVSDNQELRTLVDKGWRVCYAEWFGKKAFVDILAPHHIEAIEWHWESRIAFLEGRKPDYLAYFPVWPRGHMKSTLAEKMVVVDAMLARIYLVSRAMLYTLPDQKTRLKRILPTLKRYSPNPR